MSLKSEPTGNIAKDNQWNMNLLKEELNLYISIDMKDGHIKR